ncbi:hypothetical protein LTR37_019945 [Vermiconidia calcicola]|uniref:Uncharacterized protein n=1 Tax=Vermiconidia calcicola TaxID=1690605 RepID=A0ACC3MEK4_9PEZI|nr:hypothetical protein LTR37_019945 [Vermiconidia calcicola]
MVRRQMRWTPEQRITVHLLRSENSFTLEDQARVFNTIFAAELREAGYSNGIPPNNLRDEYTARFKKGKSTMWHDVCKTDLTDKENRERAALQERIEATAGELGLGISQAEVPPKRKRKAVDVVEDDQDHSGNAIPASRAPKDPYARGNWSVNEEYVAMHPDQTFYKLPNGRFVLADPQPTKAVRKQKTKANSTDATSTLEVQRDTETNATTLGSDVKACLTTSLAKGKLHEATNILVGDHGPIAISADTPAPTNAVKLLDLADIPADASTNHIDDADQGSQQPGSIDDTDLSSQRPDSELTDGTAESPAAVHQADWRTTFDYEKYYTRHPITDKTGFEILQDLEKTINDSLGGVEVDEDEDDSEPPPDLTERAQREYEDYRNTVVQQSGTHVTRTPMGPPLEMIHHSAKTTRWDEHNIPHSTSTAFIAHEDNLYSLGGKVYRAGIDGKEQDVMICNVDHCYGCNLGD